MLMLDNDNIDHKHFFDYIFHRYLIELYDVVQLFVNLIMYDFLLIVQLLEHSINDELHDKLDI